MQAKGNSLIFKNTVYLYVRMILFLLIKLYTSRVALSVLGVDDYGIYNLVAGVIVMFSFLNSAMNGATQRFLSIALGKGDEGLFRTYFVNAINSHVLLGLATSIVAGIVGWFLIEYKLNIPPDRYDAAMVVFFISLVTNFFTVLRTPYNAAVISFERMSFYALIGIVEVVLNLGVIYLLPIIPMDKLQVYALLVLFVSLAMLFVYVLYCNSKFPITKFRFSVSVPVMREMLSFSFISTLSSFSNLVTRQGQNMLLNIFHGVSINAATAITTQVTTALYGFISNFQVAANPQLMKNYASRDFEALRTIFYSTSKLSFFLLVFMLIPVLFCINELLDIWLEEVPSYTASFCIVVCISLLINSLGGPVWTTIQASGKIKKYQLTIFVTTILNLPVYYILLYWGCSPVSTFCIQVLTNLIVLVQGLRIALPDIGSNMHTYFVKVVLPILKAGLLALIVPVLCFRQLRHAMETWPLLISVFSISIVSSGLCIYFAGFDRRERKLIQDKIASFARKFIKLKK